MLLYELIHDIGEPAYEHDCPECQFVGTDHAREGEPKANQVDMYVHPSPSGKEWTLLRRYSSEPSNNGAMTYPGHMTSRYQPVLDAGRLAGLIP